MNHLRPAAAVQSRVMQRRTRGRVGPGPSDSWVFTALVAPVWGIATAGARGFSQMVRRAQFGALPRLERLGDADQGGAVRIRGVVEPITRGWETPGGEVAAIFARSIYLNRRSFLRRAAVYTDETKGVDFVIRLSSEETVQVLAEDVRLHDSPERVSSPNLAELERRGGHVEPGPGKRAPLVRESAVRVGDVVEAMGILVKEVAPRGQARLGRGTPLVTRLAPPAGDRHLWLRVVARPQ